MPLYEYQCPKCHNVVELQKKIDDDSLPICCEENCNVEMQKLVSVSSFQLSGHGWYKDGYSSKK